MTARIDYQIEKYSFTEINESARIAQQWAEVIAECQQEKAGSEARLRMALLNVDYITSFELPFRLQLIRAPQLIAHLRSELQITQKAVTANENRFGCVYSLKADLTTIPDTYRYRFSNRIRRIASEGAAATPYQEIAKQVKKPGERLKLALEADLHVTALDGLYWFGMQRMAADVAKLRRTGMKIATFEVQAFDDLTGTTRLVPAYRRVV
ncbi:DNA-binding protein [Enterobacteriaceae bacterium 89]|nr:DNA-binding protein [Enterobacteriaceae bacterium 89]